MQLSAGNMKVDYAVIYQFANLFHTQAIKIEID